MDDEEDEKEVKEEGREKAGYDRKGWFGSSMCVLKG